MSDLEKVLNFYEGLEPVSLDFEAMVVAARRFASLTSPETIEAWGMVREGLLNHEMPPALWSALGILDHHFTVLRSVEEDET